MFGRDKIAFRDKPAGEESVGGDEGNIGESNKGRDLRLGMGGGVRGGGVEISGGNLLKK